MATLDGLMRRTRLELADVKEPFYEPFSTSGSGMRYDLPIENVSTFFLYPAGNPSGLLVEGTNYTLDKKRGVVTFHTQPTAGARYVAEGETAKYFSDEEIEIFVQSAFDMHTRSRNISMSDLPSVEELLVAILAQIEALWVLKTSSAYDVNIHAPEGMFVPRGQRFQQLNMLVQEMEARYKELSNALGVGLYAVEMFNLRRVSRLTGRYVPLYIDREVDDTRPPQRVLPAIGNQFTQQAKSTVTTYDLQVFQGRAFSETFTLTDEGVALDLTTYPNFVVELYRTPYQTSRFRDLLPQFTTVVDAAAGTVTISLTAAETKRLETTGHYVWDLTWLTDEGEIALLKGRVLVESAYPYKNINVQVG